MGSNFLRFAFLLSVAYLVLGNHHLRDGDDLRGCAELETYHSCVILLKAQFLCLLFSEVDFTKSQRNIWF